MGYPVTKAQFLDSVALLAKNLKIADKFANGKPGRHWFQGFMKRHSTIATRVAQNLTTSRSKITEDQIRNWFNSVREYLEKSNNLEILKDPDRIFNCDETACLLNPKEKSVLVKKGSKVVYNRIGIDEKECLTVLVNASANGILAPPMILYAYKRLPDSTTSVFPKGWGIGKTDSGWMTAEAFLEYITNVFHPWLKQTGVKLPVILYVDGHVSYLSLSVTEFCRENQIILIALLPNATHILQPMDVALFNPLKRQWVQSVHQWKIENDYARLTRERFAPLFKKCLEKATKKETVAEGFKTTGLYPFNPNQVNYSKLLTGSPSKTTDQQTNNLSKGNEINETFSDTQFLTSFENRIHDCKLSAFYTSGEIWNGPKEDHSLFEFWKILHRKNLEIETTLNNSVVSQIPINDITFDENWFLDGNVVEMQVLEDGNLRRIDNSNTNNDNLRNTPLRNNFPTPFKNALYFPESTPKTDSHKVKRKLKLTPTVATSDEFIEFQRRKKIEKKEKLKNIEMKQNKKLHKENEGEKTSEERNSKINFEKTKKISLGDYVVVVYEEEYFPGVVLKLKNDEFEVKTMTMAGCYWKWPEKDDILWYKHKDVKKINPPKLINSRGQYDVPEIAVMKL